MNKQVDIINFVLIWLTLIVALNWPFELFLFSYIVIGPLHYLTEINWLDKQDYFLKRKDRNSFVWTMVIIVALLGICGLLPKMDTWQTTRPIHDALYNGSHKTITEMAHWSYVLLLLAFVMSAAWVFTERWLMRAVIVVFCAASAFFFYKQPTMAILFGVLLPTIIHVFLFTICFMLYGALKSKSGWGFVNVGMMFLVLLIIAGARPKLGVQLSQPVIDLTVLSEFDKLNVIINRWLGNIMDGGASANSPSFLKMQSFIAFAYTYHYLNWFSKTSIIKWHEVSKKKLIFSAVLWVASVGLFFVDYRLGFAASFALSVLHILLEFPLNYVSFQGVFHAFIPRKRTA